MDKVTIGSPVTSPPGGTWNELVEFVERARRLGLFSNTLPSPSAPAQVTITVKNTTSDNLNFGSVLGCGDPLDHPDSGADNGNQYRRPVFTGVAPDATTHASKFVILQSSANAGGGAEGLKIGMTPVKVYVNDAAHQFAKVKDGDTTQLESAASGPAEIWWKETGTGTKWALVLLGGGGGGGGGADAAYRVAKVTAEIAAASDDLPENWGTGTGQPYDFSLGYIDEGADPITLHNMLPFPILENAWVRYDIVYVGGAIAASVNLVANATCYEYPWHVEA